MNKEFTEEQVEIINAVKGIYKEYNEVYHKYLRKALEASDEGNEREFNQNYNFSKIQNFTMQGMCIALGSILDIPACDAKDLIEEVDDETTSK